ncbi:MAG TPA: type III pantothenate kinase [Armatimonadetes bacterium]|nr:type III pantothenate kinase [Armatimonadota bacterium]
MLLAIDIGNTHIVWGVYRTGELVAHWRVATHREKTADEYALQLRGLLDFEELTLNEIEAAIISSVVPPLMDQFKTLCTRYLQLEPLIVGENVDAGMPIRYEHPAEVGADRLVNAVAASDLCGTPVIIVDFGTATTVDAVSARGEYLGGAIAPGVELGAQALFARTAKLPRVELALPPSAIGRNTVQAMQAGIMYGTVGTVRELVTRFRSELGSRTPVVATGGLCRVIAPETGIVDRIEPELTLRGLWLIYQRARPT